MIKSPKIILIVQFIIFVLCTIVFRNLEYGNDFSVLPTVDLLIIGFSPLILLLISILIQKILVSVINSDFVNHDDYKSQGDKFWKISFLINLVYGAVIFSMAVVAVVFHFSLGIKGTSFMSTFPVFLGLILVFSLVIGLFLRIKESVDEISKWLGAFMIFLSVIIFGGSLYFGLDDLITAQPSENESIIGTLKPINQTKEDSYVENDWEGEEEESDYYGFKDMSFPDVDINDNLELGNSETQNLFKLFLAQYLNLEENQSFNGLRRAIFEGSYYEKFSDINAIDKKIRRNPEKIREIFDSYSPMFYAFLSDKIYFGSNLNLLVDALINSHDDIYGTENPEESLDKIYKTMIFGEKKEYPDYYYEKLSPYVSENVSNAINKDAKEHLEKDNYEEGNSSKYSTMWIYSFWGRRYKEKNIDVVYEILKEIQVHYEEN